VEVHVSGTVALGFGFTFEIPLSTPRAAAGLRRAMSTWALAY
jgi:hypothetical protein